MPRPQSEVWQHFSRDDKRAVCSYCSHNMCSLVGRMRVHLTRKCPSCPAHVRDEMAEPATPPKVDTVVMGMARAAPTSLLPLPLPVKKPRVEKTETQSQLVQTHQVATVMDEKTDLDGYVARAILGLALPASAVENAAFIKLVKRMSPNYDPPSAYILATSLLDLVYTETQIKLRAEVLDTAMVCLGVESWQNRFVCCIANTPSSNVFSLESAGGVQLTPDVLVDKIEGALTQIGSAKVSVIVSDTGNSMTQAVLVLEGRYPNITFLPSCVHVLNDMLTEMLRQPPIAHTLNTCTELARFFAFNRRVQTAIVRVSEHLQSGETSTPLGDPDDESPSALLDCLFAVERNRPALDILLAENDTLDTLGAGIKERIAGLAFWDVVSAYTAIFEPFLEVLKAFETDFPLISTFYHRFTLLYSHLEKYGSLASRFQQIMSDHWQGMQHPAMYTAYMLDPRFPSSSLPPEATTEVLGYLKSCVEPSQHANLVSELTRFTGRTGLFADDAIWESAQKCSPIQWWKGFIGSSCPNLQKAALRTLSFPASCGLPKSKRDMFDKIVGINTKYMNEEQARKAAVVYLNTSVDDGVNETNV